MPDERANESRETLERVARDTQSIAGAPLGRVGRRVRDHFAGRDAVGEAEGGATDPVELWGRRIGRWLSVVLGIVLVAWLGLQLGWW
jgi:hypothetical protein